MTEIRDLHGMILLDVMRYTSADDGAVYYNPVIVFSFSSDEDDQVIIPTDIHHTVCSDALKQVLNGVGVMFTSVCADVRVFDNQTGDVVETINLNQLMFQSVKERINSMVQEMAETEEPDTQQKRLLH